MIQDSRRSIWTACPSIWKCTAQVTCSNPLFCAVINRPLFGRLRSQIDVWRFRWQLWQPPLLQLSALWLLLVQLKHNCFWVNIFWRSLTVTTWGQLAQMWSFLLQYTQLCVFFCSLDMCWRISDVNSHHSDHFFLLIYSHLRSLVNHNLCPSNILLPAVAGRNPTLSTLLLPEVSQLWSLSVCQVPLSHFPIPQNFPRLQTLNIKQKLFVEFINVLCLCGHDSGQTHDISHLSVHYLRSFSELGFKNIFGPFVPLWIERKTFNISPYLGVDKLL